MDVKKISAHFFAWHAASADAREIALDFRLTNQAALDGSGDFHFLFILLRGPFGFHQFGALQDGGAFAGQRAQHVMADSGEVT